jgi:hypothetical protein
MTVSRWAVSVEFESAVHVDPPLMTRMRAALDAVADLEAVATGGANRGTGYAVAATVIVEAADAGTALNHAIARVGCGFKAAGIDYGEYRLATVARAQFDERA